jgi:hypothetical protein
MYAVMYAARESTIRAVRLAILGTMPFEVFTRRMVAQAGQPAVTIQKRGKAMTLNEAAFHALGRPEAVELLFDREARILGIRAVSPDAETAQPVSHYARGTTHAIAAKAFTDYYGIPTEVSRRRPGEMADGVLCVDLTKPGTEVDLARSRAAATASPAKASSTTGRPMAGSP